MISHGSPTRSEITFESEPPTPAAFLAGLDTGHDLDLDLDGDADGDGVGNGPDDHFTFPSPPARADSAGAELDTSASAPVPAGTIALHEVEQRLTSCVAADGEQEEQGENRGQDGTVTVPAGGQGAPSHERTAQPRHQHPPWPAAKQRIGDGGGDGGDDDDDDDDLPAPPTPTKDEIRPLPSPAVPEKAVFTASPRISSPLQSSSSWSPTLGSGSSHSGANTRPIPSPSASASTSLSRQAALSRAASLNLAGPDSPSWTANGGAAYTTPRPAPPQRSASSSSYDAPYSALSGTGAPDSPAVSTPRSARAFNRKRMSLGYISSPSNSVASPTLGMSSAAGAAPSPTTPSGSATRATFLRSGAPRASGRSVNGSPAAMRFSERIQESAGSDGTSAAAMTPREEEVNPFFSGSPSRDRRGSASQAREDGQTVMDLSKNLLAEIAKRERRVGELKDELKREEAELKSLRSRWQDSVLRDLAAENGPTSPSLARLRAPRKKPGAANNGTHDPASSAQGSTSTTASEAALVGDKINLTNGSSSAANGASKHWSTSSSSTGGGDAPVPPVPAGVAEAFRGFSAKLPAGLGSQLNAFMDNLNVAAGASGPELGSGSGNGSGTTLPRSQGGLDVLREETEALSDAGSDAGTAHPSQRTTPGPPSEHGSSSSVGHRASMATSASNSTSQSTPPTSTSPTNTGSSARTHRSTGSKRSSSLFGSFTSFKDHIEESLRAAQQQNSAEAEGAGTASAAGEGEKAFGVDGLPASVLESPQRNGFKGGARRSTESQSSDTAGLSDATLKQASTGAGADVAGSKATPGAAAAAAAGGWSQWSKKLKDAAVRAEKALGDAMTGESAGGGAGAEEQRRGSDFFAAGSDAGGVGSSLPQHQPQQQQQQHRLSPSVGAMRRTSSSHSGASSSSGNGPRRSFNFDEDNAREKSAIAELELGWLSSLVGGTPGSEKRKSRVLVSPAAAAAAAAQGDESKPRSLSPRTLLALAESDGLAPEPLGTGAGAGRSNASAIASPGTLRPQTGPAPLGRLNSSGSLGGAGSPSPGPSPVDSHSLSATTTTKSNRRQSLALNFGGMNWGFNSSTLTSPSGGTPGSDSLSPRAGAGAGAGAANGNGAGTPRRNSTALQPGNFFTTLSNAWGAEKLSAQAPAPAAGPRPGSASRGSTSSAGSRSRSRSRSRSPAMPVHNGASAVVPTHSLKASSSAGSGAGAKLASPRAAETSPIPPSTPGAIGLGLSTPELGGGGGGGGGGGDAAAVAAEEGGEGSQSQSQSQTPLVPEGQLI